MRHAGRQKVAKSNPGNHGIGAETKRLIIFVQSYLVRDEKYARFYGHLDIKTLGGAGFASQRTVSEDKNWDLSDYAGIQLDIAKGDSKSHQWKTYAVWERPTDSDDHTEKRYTLILKDTLLSRDPDSGREQATISWECDFDLPPQTVPGETKDRTVFIPWDSLNPTYRGKLKKDAEPLDLKKIKRFSIMMRRYSSPLLGGPLGMILTSSPSFFGTQEGDFSLTIKSIKAASHAPPPSYAQIVESDSSDVEKGQSGLSDDSSDPAAAQRSLMRKLSLVLVSLALVGTLMSFMKCGM
jgi:hypothetical protein